MKVKESAVSRKERINATICTCSHSQAWHFGKVTHMGPCSFPGCKCDSLRVRNNISR